MDLEQALAEIENLKGLIVEAETTATATMKTALEEQKTANEKALQVQYNKGYDASKNKFEGEKEGFISKEDVDKMLNDRAEEAQLLLQKEKQLSTVRETLLSMGAKNPSRSLKIIDEEDYNKIGTDEFSPSDFVEKYKEDIVFKAQGERTPQNFMKNNGEANKKLTLAEYAELPTADRMKISKEERAALK